MKIKILLVFLFLGHVIYAQRQLQDSTIKASNKPSEMLLFDMSLEDLLNIRVITPTKSLQKSGKAPATVLVVSSDQIKIRGYRNLAEVLNDLPDMMVHDKSDPQFYNPITVRGIFRQDRFVILLDGVKISSPTNEPLPLLENFPLYLAKQIEVVYGPGSALYGADAMAGVINIITQQGEGNRKVQIQSVGGTQGYSSNSLFLKKALKDDFNLSVGGQYSYDAQPDFSKVYKKEFDMSSHESGQFMTAYGPANPIESVNAKYSAPIKAYNVYASIDNADFTFKVLHHYVEVPTSTSLTSNNGVYNKDVFYGQGVTTASASYTNPVGRVKSTTNLIGSFYSVNPRSNFRNLFGGMEKGYKYSTGSMLKAEELLNVELSNNLSLAGGVTYELFQSVPKSPELQEPVNRKNATSGSLLNSALYYSENGLEAKFFALTYHNIGTFVQGMYSPTEQITLTVGGRYDYNSRFGSTFNPRAGIVFNPAKKTTIKALYGTAYWAPSPIVSFETFGSFYSLDSGRTYQSAYLHLPNAELKPMTSQTIELSLNQKIGNKFNATVTSYYTRIEDIIKNVSDNDYTNIYNNKFLGWDVSYVEVPYNIGNQNMYGGNVMVNSAFEVGKTRLNAYGSVSCVQGTTTELVSSDGIKEVELPMIAPWQYRVGVDGQIKKFRFSCRLLHVGRQRVTGFENAVSPDKRQTLSGYSLLNGSVSYSFADKITLFTNVQNALNQRYRNPIPVDLKDANAMTFHGSLQDPARVMIGIRAGLF
jgi:outer membrane receptor for ferrienterochelin and colicin